MGPSVLARMWQSPGADVGRRGMGACPWVQPVDDFAELADRERRGPFAQLVACGGLERPQARADQSRPDATHGRAKGGMGWDTLTGAGSAKPFAAGAAPAAARMKSEHLPTDPPPNRLPTGTTCNAT